MDLEIKLPVLELKSSNELELRPDIEDDFGGDTDIDAGYYEDEQISEQEAQELGLRERTDTTRIAAGPDWEISLEPLNYILREGQRYTYYTRFENLLAVLLDRRIKFYLSQEKILKIDIALEKAQKDIQMTLQNIRKVLKFLDEKYSIIDSSL